MRVFLDTNVLFSGLYSRMGAPNLILRAATRRRFELVSSSDVLIELARNIRKKAPRLLGELNDFLAGTPVEVSPAPVERSTYWYDTGLGSDAPIVAAAEGAEVDYFCTGDRRLLQRAKGGKLGRLRVVSPAELVRLLEAQSGHGGSGVD